MKSQTPRYTTIIHKVRIEFDLSCNEYCVADIVFSLSNNPDSKIQGWCWATRKTIGEFLGISERAIKDIIGRLIKKGMLEKDEETKYLKTTSLWYHSVVLERLKMKNIMREETAPKGKKLPREGEETSLTQGEETSYNKYNSDNNKDKDIAIVPIADNINPLIELFKTVNPSYERLFANKTQRSAISRLLKSMGREKLEGTIKFLEVVNKTPFAPTITTPLQLEEKLGALISFSQKERLKLPRVVKINSNGEIN